tara:strand:- start:3967 stop:4098 length:132 start_codon:yes stop_codon:yes gene_type:complete
MRTKPYVIDWNRKEKQRANKKKQEEGWKEKLQEIINRQEKQKK